MGSNRKRPFGYKMELGEIVLHPAEAETVRWIYDSYLAGASYNALVDKLRERGISYDGDKPWNKNMTARILADRRYTGEDGFELYCAPADAPALWDALTAAGALPCGLGARDTLRLEAAMPLYGHELSPSINPYEAGLGIFVKLEKPDFIGKAALERARPVSRRRVGLQMTGRGIAREGCPVYDGGRQVGVVTSGTHCPWVGQAVALALVDAAYKEPGTPLQVDVRGRRVDAQVVKTPFYRRG